MSMSEVKNFITLSRKLLDNPLWLQKPFSMGQAWVDLLMLANYKESYFIKRGVKITVKRGQLGISVKGLADRWGWSKGKVDRYLDILRSEHQIEYQKNNLTTLITLINYESYQTKKDSKRTPNDTPNGHQTGPQTGTSKQDNKVNKITIGERKNEFCVYVQKIYNENFQKFDKITENEIEKFLDYWGEHGPKDKKMRFEKEKSFDVLRRLKTWNDRIKQQTNGQQRLSPGDRMRNNFQQIFGEQDSKG